MTQIVLLNVNQQIAPTPATLQKTGAFISQGATTTSQFTASLLTQLSDLTPLLKGAVVISGATWAATSGGTATITSASPHGVAVADTFQVTLAGFTPAGWNGSYLATSTGANTFTFPTPANPGTVTTYGAWTPEDVGELNAMANTHFAQGSTQSVYVLELGIGSVADGVASLSAYLTQYPNTAYTAGATGYFYTYQVPRTWDGNAAFLALALQYSGLQARTYFRVTTSLTNYALYTALQKSVIATVESPALGIYSANALTVAAWSSNEGGEVTATTASAHGISVGQWFQIAGCTPAAYNGWWQAIAGTAGSTLIWQLVSNPGSNTVLGSVLPNYYTNAAIPSTEFSGAAESWINLNRSPSATNKVTPNRFGFVYGVTPFPQRGTSALRTTLINANINYIDTGAEGGISTTMINPGTTLDGNDFMYWYATDWMQINSDLALSNEIINGSNNPINPLYYNQDGINRLQARLAQVAASGVSFGMVSGQVVQTALDGPDLAAAIQAGAYYGMTVINAIPFLTYSAENPGDYKIGSYKGLSITFVPARGFAQITVNMTVSSFVSA